MSDRRHDVPCTIVVHRPLRLWRRLLHRFLAVTRRDAEPSTQQIRERLVRVHLNTVICDRTQRPREQQDGDQLPLVQPGVRVVALADEIDRV